MTRAAAVLRPLLGPAMLLSLHFALLRGLYAADIVGRLLGAARPSVALAVLLVAFYAVRLAAIFVAPGWLLIALGRVVLGLRSQDNDEGRGRGSATGTGGAEVRDDR